MLVKEQFRLYWFLQNIFLFIKQITSWMDRQYKGKVLALHATHFSSVSCTVWDHRE